MTKEYVLKFASEMVNALNEWYSKRNIREIGYF